MTDHPIFRPPNIPPSHTGTMWLNPDKTIGMEITDVFNTPIRCIARKDGDGYHVRGWRGEAPAFLKLDIDKHPEEDGLPSKACATCGGKLYWRAALVTGGGTGARWQCAKCEPCDPEMWLDGCTVAR